MRSNTPLRVLALALSLLLTAAVVRAQVKVVRPGETRASPLVATGRFTGRLVDPAGAALAGGKVAVLPSRDARTWTGQVVDDTGPAVLQLAWQDVDDSGRFSIAHEDLIVRELDSGHDPFDHGADEFDPHFVASATGCATRAIPAVAWEGGDTDFGDIMLEPGVTVSGRLLDLYGQPLANEIVWVDNHARARAVPPELAAREALDGLLGARTDASGTFRVPGLWPGELRVVRYPVRGERLMEEWVVVEPGQVLDIGEHRVARAPLDTPSTIEGWYQPTLRPRGTGTIRGHARHPSGEPAAGEWVAVMRPPVPGERETPLLTVVRCDAQGEYVVRDWPAGNWHLRIQPGGLADVALGGGETREVDIDVAGYGVVRGKLIDHGQPAAGWGIHTDFVQGGMTEADGSYEMPLVGGPGSERLCFGEEAWRTIIVSRWGEIITLDVDLGDVVVSGRVVDATSGLPVTGAVVRIGWGDVHPEGRSGPAGDFRLEAIPSAACTVHVEAVGYLPLEQFLQLFDTGQFVQGRVVEDLVLQLTAVH